MLRRGEGDTNDLVHNLDSLDVKAGENPKNFGHDLVFGFVSQLAVDLQTNSEEAKKQKGKKRRSKKQKAKKLKGKKRQSAKSRLESKDANPHNKRKI